MAQQEPARAAAAGHKPGLTGSLRRLGGALVAMLHSRVELLVRELERERLHLARLLVLTLAALLFLGLGAMTATLFLIVMFWDTHRLGVIGGLTVLYLALGVGIFLYTRNEAARGRRLFSSTVEQLRKDREHFVGH